jgi:peptidoglycan/LPS O-acetylase OafA/YrhL
MSNTFQNLINNLTPRKTFLIDGLGAVLSVFMLGFVLPRFQSTFGMPKQALYFLSLTASIFAIYSLACYLGNPKKPRNYLKAIAIANLLYCCVSIGFIIYFYSEITFLGLIYFLIEKIVVAFLAITELQITRQNRNVLNQNTNFYCFREVIN